MLVKTKQQTAEKRSEIFLMRDKQNRGSQSYSRRKHNNDYNWSISAYKFAEKEQFINKSGSRQNK